MNIDLRDKGIHTLTSGQSIDQIPKNTTSLLLYAYENDLSTLDLSDFTLNELQSIQFQPFCLSDKCTTVHFTSNCYSFDYSLMPIDLPKLKSIEMKWNCFEHVRELVIDDLESLEIVIIGGKCFRISDKERNDGIFRITNCPNLRQLIIDGFSFQDFKTFELSNLNSIQSIEYGWYCFQYVDLSLKGE